MNIAENKSFFKVPARGGKITCAHWHTADAPTAIALHGITSSHMAWEKLADQPDLQLDLIAPDLRGRGGSLNLPAPFGLKAHSEDLLKVADFLKIDRPDIIGHSLGAYIAIDFAARFPHRVNRLVLIDGGIGLPLPAGIDPDIFLESVLGPALTRLQQSFPSRASYYQFWREHPAMNEDWSDYTERYLDYDLAGEPPNLQSRVSREAVLTDGKGPISPEMQDRIDQVQAPMLLVRATRGLLNQPVPLLPDELVAAFTQRLPQLSTQTIEDTNHYTVLMGRGAKVLSGLIHNFCRGIKPEPL